MVLESKRVKWDEFSDVEKMWKRMMQPVIDSKRED